MSQCDLVPVHKFLLKHYPAAPTTITCPRFRNCCLAVEISSLVANLQVTNFSRMCPNRRGGDQAPC